jgi:SAM-dependent methyltransferase
MGRVRRTLGRVASRFESLFLPRGRLIPPLHLRWSYYRTVRHDGYRQIANAATNELLSRGLQPQHRVLDVGCGIGPLAIGLIPHLTQGSYEGFDISSEAVAWCRRTFAAYHPRFRFQHANLANTAYNRKGSLRACDFRFPYADSEFDFAFLGSVCTHLMPDEVAHYLRELARVLRPGGKCVISYYLLHEESLRGIEAGTSFLPFTHSVPGADGNRVVDRANPELAIAHPEESVLRMYADAGLRLDEPIRRGGWWHGIAHQQDVIAAVRSEE